MNLNHRAHEIVEYCIEEHSYLNVAVEEIGDAKVVDFGINVPGGLEAGCMLTEICMGGLGNTSVVKGHLDDDFGLSIQTRTDRPAFGCLGCQYAGWPVSPPDYFGMGSGPARLLRGREEMLLELKFSETADTAVLVLETRQMPDEKVINWIREDGKLGNADLVICVAPTASLAGTIQIVGRNVETTMHKLHHLEYDVSNVLCGTGFAPMPPIHHDDMKAIGWTNDAILYGADVHVWVHDGNENIEKVIDNIPSSSSRDFGKPFNELFKQYEYDFYKIDPLLFSPARITIINTKTGTTFNAGKTYPELLKESFKI